MGKSLCPDAENTKGYMKLSVQHTHNGMLLSFKKERIWACSNEWMNLEPIIQSELSQGEKDIYCISARMYGI